MVNKMKLSSLTFTSLFVLVALLLLPSEILGKDDAPEIEISTGKIKGEEKESREDKPYFAYRGIPYAAVPKGPLRFLPPQPPANWSGVKETEDFEKECLHWDPYDKKVEGSEDCLYLNVYTPKIGDGISKKLLPVLVYIGGGFFMSGSSNHYKPHYFMDLESVIIVTLNFRTGALGFLNVDGVVRGNMGLKDQNMALRWVQKNIRKFAGDASRVTLFGDGVGGAHVHFHLLSPTSKGLFHRAVSISGTAISAYSFQPRPFQAARRLAKNLNCHEKLNATSLGIDNSTVLVDCLRKIEGKKLVEVEKETLSPLRDPLSLFLPSVESAGGNESDTFLSEHPYGIIASGRQLRVPFILGINSEEGLLVTAKIQNDKQLLDIVEGQWKEFSSKFLLYDGTRRDITDEIRKFYINRNILAPVGSRYDMTMTTTTTTSPILHQASHISPVSQEIRGNNRTNIYPTLPPSLHVLPTPNSSPMTVVPILLPTSVNGTTSAYKLESFENHLIDFEDKFNIFTRLFTDRFFTVPLIEVARIQSKYSPVYLYYNKYQGQFSFSDVYSGKEKEPTPALKRVSSWFKTKVLGRTTQAPRHLGVCHGDLTPLLFKYYDAKVKENTKDFDMSKDLVNLFVKFASDPSKLEFRNVTWSAVDPNLNGTLNALQISSNDKENTMLFDVFRETGDFWKSLVYLAPFQQ